MEAIIKNEFILGFAVEEGTNRDDVIDEDLVNEILNLLEPYGVTGIRRLE